jgi:hypothetical protein
LSPLTASARTQLDNSLIFVVAFDLKQPKNQHISIKTNIARHSDPNPCGVACSGMRITYHHLHDGVWCKVLA